MGAYSTDVLQAGNLVAFVKEDGQQLAFGSGFTLEGSLVGFVSKQDIANGNLVAYLLQPFTDDAAFYGDTGLGHDHSLGIGISSHGGGSDSGGSGRGSSGSLSTAGTAQRGAVLTGVTHGADIQQAGHFVAFAKEDFQQGAFGGGFALERSLVGFVGEQDVAHIDVVANLLQPFADDAAFHSDARLGHDYGICHDISSFDFGAPARAGIPDCYI